jgi:hypothetical protein
MSTSTNASDDEILRQYLLGSLGDEAGEGVEKRLFSDDPIFWERLCLAEEELIDQYARGQLDDAESERFERHFLCTDERRGKLEFARALVAHVERRRTSGMGVWDWLRSPIATPAWAMAAAAILLVALPASVWQLAPGRAPRGDVSAWLSSGLVRSEGVGVARVAVGGCELVRLHLDPGDAEYGSYRATLHEVSGEEIWSQNRLSAAAVDGRAAVTLTLPCPLLPPGDYYVRLSDVSAGREPVLLGRYDVRVLSR